MKTLTSYIIEKNGAKYEFNIDTASDAKTTLKDLKNIWGENEIKVEDSDEGGMPILVFKCDGMGDFIKTCAYVCYCYTPMGKPLTLNGDIEDDADLAFYIGKDNFAYLSHFLSKVKEEIKNVEKYFNK